MLRTRKNAMVVMPIMTSATQKAVSQLCCLATVLKGSPAMKAPTVTNTKTLQLHERVSLIYVISGHVTQQLTVCHQCDDGVRRSTEIGRSTFACYHSVQGDWSIRRKPKHGTKEENPNLSVKPTLGTHQSTDVPSKPVAIN